MAGWALRKRFTNFKKLPLEVRLIIWEMTLPGPRLVKIRQKPVRKTFLDYKEETGYEWPPLNRWTEVADDIDEALLDIAESARADICTALGISDVLPGPFYDAHLLGIVSDCPPPEVTYVCRESYGVVSRHYTKVFACPGSIPGTYFNFDLDTLYLRPGIFSHYFKGYDRFDRLLDGLTGHFRITDSESLSRVQNLAILLEGIEVTERVESFLGAILEVFDGAKLISLIKQDYIWGSSTNYGKLSGTAGDGCIIEPISFHSAMQEYCSCQDDISRGKPRKLQIPILASARMVTTMVARLEAKWKKTATGIARPFPKIQANSLVTSQQLKDLNMAVSLYTMALKRHEQQLRDDIYAAGFCSDDVLSDDEF